MKAPIKDRLLRMRWWLVHMNRRQLRRLLYAMTRPASYPYISGDGFRRLAKHRYDETSRRIIARTIKAGDTIFVSTTHAAAFFEEVEPAIKVPHKLITHNSDLMADEALVSRCNDNILAWFAQNNTFRHPKVAPLPIGLENLHYYDAGVPREYSMWRQYSGSRKNRILVGFSIATNPRERQAVLDAVAEAPAVDRLPVRLSQTEYLRTLVGHKFMLSPPGNGLDTHRTWEAMYVGVIPIVKDSVAMRAFSQLGLPLWIVDSWDELLSVSESDLESKYNELGPGFKSRALWMDYWRELILGQQPEPMPTRPKDSKPDPAMPGKRRLL